MLKGRMGDNWVVVYKGDEKLGWWKYGGGGKREFGRNEGGEGMGGEGWERWGWLEELVRKE